MRLRRGFGGGLEEPHAGKSWWSAAHFRLVEPITEPGRGSKKALRPENSSRRKRERLKRGKSTIISKAHEIAEFYGVDGS